MLNGDLILILISAFKKTTLTCIGQPQIKHVEKAANRYRPIPSVLHKGDNEARFKNEPGEDFPLQ